jgi:GABA permease
MRNYLVVANQTLGGEHLLEVLRERVAEGPCRLYLVVPATRVREHFTHTDGEARAAARQRLDEAMTRFKTLGVEIDGEVGSGHVLDAINEALEKQPFDEIILSTLPAGLSLWLKQDLPHRVERTFGLPLTHVAAREPAATGAQPT